MRKDFIAPKNSSDQKANKTLEALAELLAGILVRQVQSKNKVSKKEVKYDKTRINRNS